MTDYKKYVIAVNKIFEIVDKMKLSWTDQDNLNYLKKNRRLQGYSNRNI